VKILARELCWGVVNSFPIWVYYIVQLSVGDLGARQNLWGQVRDIWLENQPYTKGNNMRGIRRRKFTLIEVD